jgi:hypothetical protein
MKGPVLPEGSRPAQTGQPHGHHLSVVMGMIARVMRMATRECQVVVFVAVAVRSLPIPGFTVVKRGNCG